MKEYKVKAPDGSIIRIKGPENATDEQLIQAAQAAYAQKPKAPEVYDPTEGMTTAQKFLAGTGKAFVDVGRGVGQMMGLVSREDIQRARELDAPLFSYSGAGDLSGKKTDNTWKEVMHKIAEQNPRSPMAEKVLKKNKRTLVNFQDQFLIPFIEKAAWRFMQFNPEEFPVKDWKFIPSSTLGMLAREVEQLQIINLLKTLGSDNPITPILIQGVIANSSLPNKNGLLQQIAQATAPNPQQQQMQQMAMQLQMQDAQSKVEKTMSEIQVNKTVAAKNVVDIQTKPQETQAKLMTAISTNLPNEDDKISAEFDRRVKIAELMLKEADMDQNLEIVKQQMQSSNKPLTN